MRNLLAFLAAAALTIAGLGWYLDWYKFQSTPASAGHRSITVDIDGKKIGEDVRQGAERGAAKIQDALDRKKGDPSAATPAGKDEPQAPSAPPGFPPPPDTEDAPSGPNLVP